MGVIRRTPASRRDYVEIWDYIAKDNVAALIHYFAHSTPNSKCYRFIHWLAPQGPSFVPACAVFLSEAISSFTGRFVVASS